MPIEFRRAYLEEIRLRYRNSTKKQKGKILDEFCAICNRPTCAQRTMKVN